jgi:hypothetical protein
MSTTAMILLGLALIAIGAVLVVFAAMPKAGDYEP